MDPKEKKQKRITSSETADPFLSKMDQNKKKKRKRKRKDEKSLVIASPSQLKIDVQEAMKKQIDIVVPKEELQELMKKQNDVAMFLMRKVISTVARNSNFVFSPSSINAVLTMVYVSSSGEEDTLRSFILSFLRSSSIDKLITVFREIANFVLVDRSESGGPKIAAVNGVWVEKTISVNPSLKDLFENFFKASFERVDFTSKGEQARMEVNSWASNHTNGLIKDLLPPGSVTSDTEQIYGNALYFKGTWQSKFPKSLTRDKKFHLLNGTSVSVPFMSNNGSKQYIGAYKGFKVLILPFRGGGNNINNRSFSMYFYLPHEKDGLGDLMTRMSSTCGFLDDHIPRKKVETGDFRIPKFNIKFGFEASKVFKELELDVSLYHKAWVEINEDGAEAASFTAIRGNYIGCCISRKIDFVADHPFVFLIREDTTGTLLFAGQILDPSLK